MNGTACQKKLPLRLPRVLLEIGTIFATIMLTVRFLLLWGLTCQNHTGQEEHRSGGLRITFDHLRIFNVHQIPKHTGVFFSPPSERQPQWLGIEPTSLDSGTQRHSYSRSVSNNTDLFTVKSVGSPKKGLKLKETFHMLSEQGFHIRAKMSFFIFFF